ncbi:unnamed protein product [Nezara viridula]|uniref:Uncharacterized protein n=1 Tax=Nezara viridula TaxID=85310 RepID=A0A9P0HDE6_NEZVI|nr:unnamed protein product [Nezara viridula]
MTPEEILWRTMACVHVSLWTRDPALRGHGCHHLRRNSFDGRIFYWTFKRNVQRDLRSILKLNWPTNADTLIKAISWKPEAIRSILSGDSDGSWALTGIDRD